MSDIPDDPNSPDYNEKREALIAELIASVAENEKLVKEAFRLSDIMHQKQEEAHAAEIKTLELKLRNQEIEFKKRLKIETIKQEQRSGLEATEQELRLKVELHELELKLKVAAKEHERELNLERSKNQATLMIERNNALRAHHGSLARVLAMLTTVNSKRHAQKAEAEKSQIESLTEQLAAMKVSLDQNLETEIKRPVTSDALEDWHHNIRLKEGINVKKTTTDYNRINDFIAFAGDQPVNKYKFDQFQKYAIMLAAVPSTIIKNQTYATCHLKMCQPIIRTCQTMSVWRRFPLKPSKRTIYRLCECFLRIWGTNMNLPHLSLIINSDYQPLQKVRSIANRSRLMSSINGLLSQPMPNNLI
ncbi:MAG: hypothetical protein ABJP89_17255 [Lentilitoribacter sp.]